PLYRVVFSTTGAGIVSFELKKFRQTTDEKSPAVQLIDSLPAPLLMAQSDSLPLGLPANATYSVSHPALHLTKGSETLLFTYRTANGIIVNKLFTFHADRYDIGLDYRLQNNSSQPFTATLNTQLPVALGTQKGGKLQNTLAVSRHKEEFVTLKPKKIAAESRRYSEQVSWGGFADKYFLTAFIGQNQSISSLTFQKSPASTTEKEVLVATIQSPSFNLPAGSDTHLVYTLFAGPKETTILKAVGSSLEQALDLGWTSVIARPLLWFLNYFYRFVHNYGLAIIILTVIIKLIFAPLTHKAQVSMKAMQKLQPKMTELREKFKNDREAMNRAIFELYRTHKVNPLGGCLPMVIQIPVFFALYSALMHAIELRHAPFFFWITDLSAADPYYISPILMGATMFLQQKMSPSTLDPMQAQMFMMLPLIFTIFCFISPSGLVLYWLVNNILTIAQQAYINKYVKA
ncbi:MAG TPA: membrane protein insertase YidC, partial [Geobacterales bacterium]|nr:membrane protein insertase YidC [Geobacterales bacterium]